MKRKNFIRRLSYFFAFIAILSGFIAFNSCEPPEPPRPQCEIDRVGTVTVKNSTGYNIWTDVTWGNVVENYEKLLYNGSSYKYNNIPAGGIEIWATFDGSDWVYNNEYLTSCQDMTYTWFMNRKSDGTGSLVLELETGEFVIPIYKEKH